MRPALSLLIIGALLGGCDMSPLTAASSTPSRAAAVVPAQPLTADDLSIQAFAATAVVGQEQPIGGLNATARLEDEYLAASGLRCRRVRLLGQGNFEPVRIACFDNGGWQLRRSILGRDLSPGG